MSQTQNSTYYRKEKRRKEKWTKFVPAWSLVRTRPTDLMTSIESSCAVSSSSRYNNRWRSRRRRSVGAPGVVNELKGDGPLQTRERERTKEEGEGENKKGHLPEPDLGRTTRGAFRAFLFFYSSLLAFLSLWTTIWRSFLDTVRHQLAICQCEICMMPIKSAG